MVDLRRIAARKAKRRRPLPAIDGDCNAASATRYLISASQVRMNPSISLSAQASVFSIGSPCMWRTVILVMMPCT